MKKTKNKILIRTISLMLAVITLIPANIGAIIASAMVVNGTGSSGNSSTSTATGNYSIPKNPVNFAPDSNADIPVAGMRFSVYNTYEKSPKFTHSSRSIDVFGVAGHSFIGDRHKFDTKLNKMQLRNSYRDTNFTTSKNSNDCYRDIDIGKTLPPKVLGMKSWEGEDGNISPILNLIDSGKYSYGVASLEYGDRILVEPLFPIQVGGVLYCLTVTEIAIMGAAMFGTGSDGTGGKAGSFQQGTWSFISAYTNRIFPDTMRLESMLYAQTDDAGINGSPLLWNPPAIGTRGETGTFLNIIENGHGIHVASITSPAPPPKPCNIYINYWLNGMPLKNADGSVQKDKNGNVVREGQLSPLAKSIDVQKGSVFTLTQNYEHFLYKPATASTGSSFRLDVGKPDITERSMSFIQIETRYSNGVRGPIYYSPHEAITVSENMTLTYCYGVEEDKNTVLMADGDM